MTPAYVFDLDGTLIDTAPDLCAALNELMADEGRRAIALEEMPLLIGNGVGKLVARAFERTGAPLEPQRAEAVLGHFLPIYQRRQFDTSRPYPGVIETLEKLKSAGARLAVLTNKPHEAAVNMIAGFDLGRFFPVVYGGGKRAYLKPDARLFAEVVAELGGGGPAIMVGDSRPDIETARNAGAPSVLVSYGYSSEPANALGADAIVSRFADVPDAAERLWAAAANS